MFRSVQDGSIKNSVRQFRIGTFLFTVSAIFALSSFSENGFAQTRSQIYGSSLTQQTMTAYVQGDMVLNTYESEAAGSKESNTSTTWKIGVYAGESRKLGIQFRSSENYVPFDLNESSLAASWKDTIMQWRLGWFYPALAVGLSEIEVSSSSDASFDLFGASVGAGLGVFIPLFRKAVFHATTMVFETPNSWDKKGEDVKLGQRIEQDIGTSIDLTKDTIDFVVGYRTRSYTVSWNGNTYNENNQGAYAGLKFGLYF